MGDCEGVVVVEVLRDELVHVMHTVHHLYRVVPDEKRSEMVLVEVRKPLNEAASSKVALVIAQNISLFNLFGVPLLEVRMLDDLARYIALSIDFILQVISLSLVVLGYFFCF